MNELQAREQGFSGRWLEDALTQRLRSGILVLPRESDGDGIGVPNRMALKEAADRWKRLFFIV